MIFLKKVGFSLQAQLFADPAGLTSACVGISWWGLWEETFTLGWSLELAALVSVKPHDATSSGFQLVTK